MFCFFSCRYFPYEDETNHKLVREIGNVTTGLEITFQFAVKPKYIDGKMAYTMFIKLIFEYVEIPVLSGT